jgi:hypothetical protein
MRPDHARDQGARGQTGRARVRGGEHLASPSCLTEIRKKMNFCISLGIPLKKMKQKI